MATEPTFDQAGLSGANSPGWYPDPDPEYRHASERYWDGEGWRPPWDRRPHTSAQVHLWYVLACMLPFTLSVLLPKIPWDAAPETGSLSMWLGVIGQILLAGFIPWLIGVAGTATGFFRFEVRRFLRVGPARAWNFLAWTVAVILLLWGALATLGLLMMMMMGEALGAGLSGL